MTVCVSLTSSMFRYSSISIASKETFNSLRMAFARRQCLQPRVEYTSTNAVVDEHDEEDEEEMLLIFARTEVKANLKEKE